MTLVRWDPFRDLMNLHDRTRRFVDGEDEVAGSWAPPVDIFERGDDLVVRAEVPGVDRKELDITVEENTLVLRGGRKREKEFKHQDAYRLERSFGTFVRSFRLPGTVDASRISAHYENGILEITLPKAEHAKPRKVQIKAA